MEGTRAKILNLLQKRGHETVDGLAKSLGLTSATVRRHLDILQRDHLIAYEEVRKKTGRPEYSFFLTESGHEVLPKHYHRMLGRLLREISSFNPREIERKGGQQILTLAFQRLSQQVLRQHLKYWEGHDGKGLQERLSTLLEVLRAEDFLPEAEEANGMIRIMLHNCPFRYVALGNTSVCNFDSSIISSILQLPVSKEMSIQEGDRCCTYVASVSARELAPSTS